MNNNELISIIILSHKNLQYIKQTINSVLIQDYNNLELIIADDGSYNFDNKKYENYINDKNKGNIKKSLYIQMRII